MLMVPALEAEPYPTLGPQLCDFIQANLVHGPGDLRGEPARIDDEKRALIARMYEVYPPGHAQAGRRRFRRVALSVRKGSAKTELAAWIAACELHPAAPVRCTGFRRGRPIGGGVTDPYIPLMAYTEEQSEELAYGTLRVILAEGPLADDFDIGLERIVRKSGDGKAVAVASAPAANDGARTTFQVFDETHRLILPRQLHAHQTMLANLPKRRLADAWALETTTAFEPGQGSVAEHTMDYARQVVEGKQQDSRLFFFHRQASDKHDLDTKKGVRAAVLEASGPTASWSDIDGICEQFDDPTADTAFLKRVWLNIPQITEDRAFDVDRWKALGRADYQVAPGALITLGFDGSRTDDATALIATEVETGYQWVVGLWEKPLDVKDWAVPEVDVDAAVQSAFSQWQVWRMYADPPHWDSWIAQWKGRFGDKVVLEWHTWRARPMAFAARAFHEAIVNAEVSHDGNQTFAAHIGNARKHQTGFMDDRGQPLWRIRKERDNSPHKIDAGTAAILSWEARTDAIAAGATATEEIGAFNVF